jgi:hypothetical protein
MDELLVDEVAEEIAAIERDRLRILEARAANPHLDHWKVPGQLATLDRHLARLRKRT